MVARSNKKNNNTGRAHSSGPQATLRPSQAPAEESSGPSEGGCLALIDEIGKFFGNTEPTARRNPGPTQNQGPPPPVVEKEVLGASSMFTSMPAFKSELMREAAAEILRIDEETSTQGPNRDLKQKLRDVFSPLGIIAWSGCCRPGCTGSYDEFDPEFVVRPKGMQYFRLHLGGMNYQQEVKSVEIYFEDIEYVHENSEQEFGLVDKWCQELGFQPEDQHTINMTSPETVELVFARPLKLEAVVGEVPRG